MEFDEYVRLRGAGLVRLARLLTGDRQLGEDVTQDVLAHAFVKWQRIGRLDAPDAYLRRMLVNATISRWRRAASRELVLAEPIDSPAAGSLSQDSADRDAMWRLVKALPTKQRAAIVLRFYEDLDDTASAELLGCSPVTVRTQIKRALATLRSRLAAESLSGNESRAHESLIADRSAS